MQSAAGNMAAANADPAHLLLPATGEATDEDPVGTVASGQEQTAEELPTGEPGTVLDVKHLDEVLDLITGKWTTKPTPVEEATTSKKKSGKYDCFVFTVIRRFTPTNPVGRGGKAQSYNVTKLIGIQSAELRKIGSEVIGSAGVSWHAKPLKVSDRSLFQCVSHTRCRSPPRCF